MAFFGLMVFVTHNSISVKNPYGHKSDQGPSNDYNIQGAPRKQVPNILVVACVIVGHDIMVFDRCIVVFVFWCFTTTNFHSKKWHSKVQWESFQSTPHPRAKRESVERWVSKHKSRSTRRFNTCIVPLLLNILRVFIHSQNISYPTN